jgi:hypothetical protein
VHEWLDFEFIVGDAEELIRPTDELTGWEMIRFEVADEEDDSEI